jgi:hypothetical protein
MTVPSVAGLPEAVALAMKNVMQAISNIAPNRGQIA